MTLKQLSEQYKKFSRSYWLLKKSRWGLDKLLRNDSNALELNRAMRLLDEAKSILDRYAEPQLGKLLRRDLER